MLNVRVGGVPEHFNLAWHLAMESGAFSRHGISVLWKDVPGGTGEMCRQLRENELDVAIGLTEGIVNDIMHDNPSKIIQFYVNSPLRWGIYVKGNSSLTDVSETEGLRYAISRFKSGSHLMAFVSAAKQGFTLEEKDFVIVKDLEGARKALKNGDAEVFMWEKYMTKPLADSGEFKMIGEIGTPWPCFVIAATDRFIAEHRPALNDLVNVINLSCQLLKNNSAAPGMISKRYGIRKEDAVQWFRELEYAAHPEIDELEMSKILFELYKLKIIDHIPEVMDICFGQNVELI